MVIKKSALIQYTLLYLMMVFNGGIMYTVLMSELPSVITILMYAIVAFGFLSYLFKRSKYGNPYCIIITVILTASVVIVRYISGGVGIAALVEYLTCIMLPFLALCVDKNRFVERVIDAVCLFAVISVVCYFVQIAAPEVLQSVLKPFNSSFSYNDWSAAAYGGNAVKRFYMAWALVAQYLCNTIIDTVVLFITVPWRPRMLFSRKSAIQLIGYGWKLTASSLINALYTELRSLIIGRVYSSADLAYYNRGNQFPSLIITNVDTAIGKVVFPAMTKVAEEKQRIKQIGRRSMKTTSYIIFPVMIGLMAVSEPLVRLLLTEKWLVCVPFLQCSCIYYMCQPIQTTNWQIIKAVGRSDLCLKLEILKKIIGVSIILLTMNFGVLAIAIGNAAFAVVSMFINIVPNRRLIGYSVAEQIKDILPPLVLSILMGITVMYMRQIDAPTIIVLALQIIAGSVFYFIGSYLFKLDSFLYLLDMTKAFLKGKTKYL